MSDSDSSHSESDYYPHSDSEDSPQPEANESENSGFKHELLKEIQNIETSGSFATHGSLDSFINPGLYIQGVGDLRLPMDSGGAATIVNQSRKAPFGRGNETVFDESVRKTWEIDESEVTFKNEKRDGFVQQLVERAKDELGVPGSSEDIQAKLYKLLLYEEGSMFKAHSDTERVPGMFATLTICLPSEHTGGTIHFRHNGKELSFDTDKLSAFSMSFTAWYSDVIHEIAPIKSGYRAVLVYNIISTRPGTFPSASLMEDQVGNIVRRLQLWRSDPEAPPFLCYALDHRYTQTGLQVCHLKGSDLYRVHSMDAACKEDNTFWVFLGHLIKKFERDNNYREFEETNFVLKDIVDMRGASVNLRKVRFSGDRILQPRLYKKRRPDFQKGGEYQGNEHASIEYCYENTVAILVRKECVTAFVLGSKYTPKQLRSHLTHLRELADLYGHVGFYRDMMHEAYEAVFAMERPTEKTPSGKHSKDRYIECVAETAYTIGDEALFERAVDALRKEFYDETFFFFGESIDFDNPSIPLQCLIDVFSRIRNVYISWTRLKAFRKGFLTQNLARDNPEQQEKCDDFIRARLTETLRQKRRAHLSDGAALIEISSTVQREVHEECKAFIARIGLSNILKSDMTLGDILTLESLSFLQTCEGPQLQVRELVSLSLDAAHSTFNLTHYSSKLRDREDPNCFVYSSWPDIDSVEKYDNRRGRRDARNVLKLYRLLKDSDLDKASDFLWKIHRSVQNFPKDEFPRFVHPLLEKFVEVLDTKLPSAEAFYKAMLETYVVQFVGMEPAKPIDWSRPDDLVECVQNCTPCKLFREFMLDKEQQSIGIDNSVNEDGHIHNLRFRWTKVHYCEVEFEWISYKKRKSLVTFTKTLDGWKAKHSDWESRVTIAQTWLQSLPQDMLEQVLAEKYDTIMNLSEVKLADDKDQDIDLPDAA